MNTNANELVQKLWNLCSLLREDGVTYHQYVAELAFVLFLKMAKETKQEDQLPKGYRWDDLARREGMDQLQFYKELLLHLGTKGSNRVQDIYANANTSLRHPKSLNALVKALDALDWYGVDRENLGDLYEGLLEKNATEVKSGAGQYFTPRPLVDAIIAVVKPQAGETVQDPASGTGGFLIAADRYVRSQTDNYFDLTEKQQAFQRRKAFYGVELVPETRRLALMNMALHDLEGELILGDTLSPVGRDLPKADIIITNPPFGTKKGGGKPERDDFTFPTSNKQFAFLEHVYRGLKAGGRAAVVVPDNVLFEENVGQEIRADLMDKCDLHTVLRLPTGIFYAQGVKTNVLFFTRGQKDKGNTKAVWFYDMRTNAPAYGKRTPFLRKHFDDFETAFGEDPYGKSKRKDQGSEGRFRKFSREQVEARGDNLDLLWLKSEELANADELLEPEIIAAEIKRQLQVALSELDALTVASEFE
ncbi:SAM-dependent methyltransferase [Corallococcus sp. AB049A]|uniref:site-specific DNA-methyltransferase (adenine-specific) n=1 Tax=Corallococcus interemptor TaxID=2316720 RepID=A0A3A8PYR9_9BACT|nr:MULTISPECIES: N-6 DNA methylase [Corallococcus]RKH42356.1 SAM-dependent methyltransferase [Corallococcus sp. AB050B]RKH60191.1 SAM-dependent methyltransferase [Corallococcus interemptor]RKI66141.1 SAM-dependent methyltransferase [Corallococcus sp. AB049A]